MATDNNIKKITAADIEKYHKGLLSAKERHALEKAALDDPFLADALEGYAVAGANIPEDINDLKERLAGKIQGAKVVAMKGSGKTSFPWLRVAALVIVIAGLGLLANQFLFNYKKQEGIAKLEKNPAQNSEANSASDSGKVSDASNVAGKNNFTATEEQKKKGEGNRETSKTNNITIAPDKNPNSETPGSGTKDNKQVTVNNSSGNGIVSVPVSNNEPKPVENKIDISNDISKEKTKAIAASETKVLPDKNADGIADQFDKEADKDLKKKNAVANSRKLDDERSNAVGILNQQTNTFRGRVTDANNVGLPFARVYNPNDNNAGTYTDVAGNFNLTFPDSVLDVQVKSVGFENTTTQLRSNVTNNQVVLQDDRKSLSEVVLSNQKPNAAARSLNANVKLEEPEPADGWDNYDTYIANNLDIPEEIKTKPSASGQVQVSFEVNKEGEPIKFKIEKSLCGKCDKEAIRLIKQGPKWKRSPNKNGRTVVTINF